MPITKASSSAVAPGAKGELVVGNATNDSAILAVGANGTVLKANSATATGLEWGTASSGGMTLLSTLTPTSGANLIFSSIPSTYKHLLVVFEGVSSNTNSEIYGYINNFLSSASYTYSILKAQDASIYHTNSQDNSSYIVGRGSAGGSGQDRFNGYVWFYDYAGDSSKVIRYMNTSVSSVPNVWQYNGIAFNRLTSVINEVDFAIASGAFTGGTIKLYGVS